MDATQLSPFSEKEKAAPVKNLLSGENSKGRRVTVENRRGEVDTSAPFESVKEAVDRFGGSAVWNSQLRMLFLPEKRHCVEECEVLNVKETSVVNMNAGTPSGSENFHPVLQKETENLCIGAVNARTDTEQSSGSILDELELAKMNLSRTTYDLTKIRAFIESLYNEIESERTLQEKTSENLSSLGTIVSFLEEDLRKTTLKLQMTKEANDNWNSDPADITRDIEQLRSQTQQFRQTAAAAKSESSKLTSEIEQMQAGIKTAEIRWLAAKKMEEAAKAAEAVALVRMKDMMNNDNSMLTLPVEKNVMIVTQQYDDSSSKKIGASMLELETENLSKLELLAKVKEATAEVKTSRKVLENAINRLEAVNSGKLATEGALWRWSEHGEKMHSSSTEFKNSYSRMLELNGFNLASHTPKRGSKQAISIGEILSKKIIGLEEYEHALREKREKPDGRARISLGQILNRKPGLIPPRLVGGFACKQQPLKRKKFGSVVFSQLLKQESKTSRSKKRSEVLLQGNTRQTKAEETEFGILEVS